MVTIYIHIYIYNHYHLVGGWPTHLEKWWSSSMGRMPSHIWNGKAHMFDTTTQYMSYINQKPIFLPPIGKKHNMIYNMSIWPLSSDMRFSSHPVCALQQSIYPHKNPSKSQFACRRSNHYTCGSPWIMLPHGWEIRNIECGTPWPTQSGRFSPGWIPHLKGSLTSRRQQVPQNQDLKLSESP
jgi:hypothetical protein